MVNKVVNLDEMEHVGDTGLKGAHFIQVKRDKWRKFYVVVDGKLTQKSLTVKEMVRYLLNGLNHG